MPGRSSAKRDYYVWSDDNTKYSGARSIFTDTEGSNWQWDEEAQAYYWHRFFTTNRTMNFDNPHVFNAIMHVMRFWLDAGVDGMRLDAMPYLCDARHQLREPAGDPRGDQAHAG